MSGYTPVFNNALDGTLYGKWPHTGVWLCLLSQCDRHGNIDVVPKLLAAKIGVSEKILLKCIADFMEPDPGSRTGDLDGRRLELIDPANRNWGWRVINHGIYREKARKAAYDADRIQSGKDAERKKAERERKAAKDAVPRSPDASRDVPLSDSDSDSDSDSNSDSNPHPEREAERASRSLTLLGADFELTADMRAAAEAERIDPDRTFAKFCDHYRAEGKRKHDWTAAWRNWCRREGDHNGSGKPSARIPKTLAQLEAEEAAAANAQH